MQVKSAECSTGKKLNMKNHKMQKRKILIHVCILGGLPVKPYLKCFNLWLSIVAEVQGPPVKATNQTVVVFVKKSFKSCIMKLCSRFAMLIQ